MTASNGAAPYTYAVTAGALPAGLTISTAGLISGTPTTAGPATFTITATDSTGATGSQAYTISVSATSLQITTTTLVSYVTANTGYSQTIATTGGVAPTTFAVSAGNLPAGLSLAASTGVISGTPTTAGTATFTITATDSTNATTSQAYTVVVIPPEFVYNSTTETLVITLIASLPNFEYTQKTTVSGTTTSSTYTFTLTGSGAATVSQTFPDSLLTTAPASGTAAVTVNGEGAAGTAILITNDTYVANGTTLETPERVSLGSKTNAGVGTLSKFVGNSTSSAEYNFLALSNFPISYAYAGRNDGTALLYGTTGTGEAGFVSAGYFSYIAAATTGAYYHEVAGAPSVYGYSAGNAGDFAYHYSMNAGSSFVVSGVAFSYMSGSQTNPEDSGATDTFFNVGVGFTINTGVSNNPGADFAYIIDSPGNDTFIGGNAYSYMYIQAAGGSYTEFDTAYAFALVYAESFVGGTDTAINNDPSKNISGGNWHPQCVTGLTELGASITRLPAARSAAWAPRSAARAAKRVN